MGTTTTIQVTWTILLMTIAHGSLDIMTTTTVHTLITMAAKTTTTKEEKNSTQESTPAVDLLCSETWTTPGIKLTLGVDPGPIKLVLSMLIAMVNKLNAAFLFL